MVAQTQDALRAGGCSAETDVGAGDNLARCRLRGNPLIE
jgi:hypothetical protein